MNAPPTEYDTLTTVCDVLASAYRRQALRYLLAGDDDVASVEDLVDELIDHDETADDRRRIAIKLHHVALPKLAAAGFIEYDARTQTARVCEHLPPEWHTLPASVVGT
ncbi:DUF7344 domain-containing protein [Haladaptatus sp. NG-SE-30]